MSLSSSSLLAQPSIEKLVDLLSNSMQVQEEDAPVAQDLALDYLDDDEIEAMLGSMLVNIDE